MERFGYPPEVAQQDVADLIRLPRRIVSTADLAYPALALAQRLSLPLVTADQPLFRRLEGVDLEVRWLGRWPA